VNIEQVRARTVRLPLERPIHTSNLTIDHREYVLVEVVAEGGLRGCGFGFTRDGLVAQSVERNLAPLLIGADARLTERLWERMVAATRYLGRRGLMMRAISAVDIALWDLKGRALGQPLWTLLGGYRERVPAFAAGGYYGPSTDPEAVREEFGGYRSAGFRGAKINLGGLGVADDMARVEAARDGLGSDRLLAVDFNGSLDTARDALAWADRLTEFGVAFIEEPFLMDNLPALRAFARRSPIDVAVGEDESGRWAFAELIRARSLDILRHDATLVGGVTEWMRVAALGLANRLRLFPHWFPEIHIHMAAALPDCLGVELVTPESKLMNFHRLVHNPVFQQGGEVLAPSGPGLGIDWNWELIEEATV
jgi:L-alanine-DL-glutamate epimerase-like enolase superfamily enzyme